MKPKKLTLSALLFAGALGLAACGGGDSSESAVESESTDKSSAAEATTEETSVEESGKEEPERGEAGEAGEAVTATSPGGAISLTATPVSLSDSSPKIVVTWEAQPNAGDKCLMILTRTDPRGYLLNTEEIEECSGSYDVNLVKGLGEDTDDVAGDHVITVDNIDEKATVEVPVTD